MDIKKLEVIREGVSFLTLSSGSINTFKFTIQNKGIYCNKVFLSVTSSPKNGFGNTLYAWEETPDKTVDKVQKLFKQ